MNGSAPESHVLWSSPVKLQPTPPRLEAAATPRFDAGLTRVPERESREEAAESGPGGSETRRRPGATDCA